MTSKCIYIYNIKLNEENTQFKIKIKNSNNNNSETSFLFYLFLKTVFINSIKYGFFFKKKKKLFFFKFISQIHIFFLKTQKIVFKNTSKIDP